MLQGQLYFNDPNHGTIMYTVYGRDSFADLKLYIQNTYNDYSMLESAQRLFDKHVDEKGEITYPFDDVNTSPCRRLDIKRSNNKFKTNLTNKDLCVKVSSFLRYIDITAKSSSGTKNTLDANHEFSDVKHVELEGFGKVSYKMGLITEIHVANRFVKLDLITTSDDMIEDSAIFKELKEKDKYGRVLSMTPISIVGFKLDESNLGFEYVPRIAKEYASTLGMFETIEDVIANNPEKNTAWILERDYQIVSDENLEEVIAMFMAHDGFIAFDTETSGLGITFKSRTGEADQLVGVVLSIKKGTGYYFPLQHKLFDNLCGGDHFYFMDKYMRPILEGKQIITHNITFDWKVAHIYEINVNCVYDTMIAFGVTKRYEYENFEYGLKALTKNIFGLDMFDLDDFVTGSSFSDSNIAFWDLPYELVRRYAPADADMTLSLYEYLEHHNVLNNYGARRVFELEIDFAKCVSYSEFYGYHIDVNKIPDMEKAIIGGMEKYKAEMFAIAGREFNPSSPKQLVEIMYDDLKIEPIGGKRGTSKDLLKVLAGVENPDGSPKYPFVVALKKFRDNEGIYKNFLKKLHEFATPDGFIFPRVMALGTTTGRCSVNNPNYQSYNDPVKKHVTPREGYVHLDSDFAQIEQRVLVSMADSMFPEGKPLSLMKDFDDADMDYHQYQAARMFNVPYASVTKSMRQQSKGINFGLPYGMGDESLGANIFGERTKENTAKAGVLRQKFFQGQEKIEMFFNVVRGDGVRNGYTSTKFGRRRYYHKGQFTVAEIRRQAGNHVIQGCLDGDVRIQTKEVGIVKIKYVVGYNLHVWDGEQWSNGDITFSGKKQKCIITFTNGQKFVCSPIHKFSVVDYDEDISEISNGKKFVECKDLKQGVKIDCNTKSDLRITGTSMVCKNEFTTVKSVEITDEYIDMYDVCNTDRGYYVADGIITHNTAADIYKLAVVSLFRRVCKEGWLGKVLFNAFVHDEVLLEVHKSINYFEFMTIWREEFEVKIEGFCRLFAGVGVGNCWYDAKKQDLPPQYSDILISEYYEGMPWDEDIQGFIDHTNKGLEQYFIDRVRLYILDPEVQGHVIKPAVYNILGGVKDDIIDEIKLDDALVQEYNAFIGSNIITYDGCKSKNLQDWIKIYCKYYNIDCTNINVLAPEDITETAQNSVEDEKPQLEYNDVSNQEIAFNRVQMYGYHVDYSENIIYLGIMQTPTYSIMDKIFPLVSNTGNLKVVIFTSKENVNSAMHTESKLQYGDVRTIQSYYSTAKLQGGQLVNAVFN